MKKILTVLLVLTLSIVMFAACGGSSGNAPAAPAPTESSAPAAEAPAEAPAATAVSNFDANREITVVSRENGSGTRGAFVELTGVEVRDDDGNTTDRTTVEAAIGNSTSAIMTNVAGDTYAIGYISTGSVNNTIKTVSVDGVEPTAANILAGNYKISRPFIIVTKGNLEAVTEDFISFILSKEGQEVIAASYIPIDSGAAAFQSNGATGKIVVGGSTSVTPVMEKLSEAYLTLNPGAAIEIHSTGSGAGITGAIDGVVDIGMSSREIKDSEMEELDQNITICKDGIAMIVNNNNPITNVTTEQVREIYTGEITRWSGVQ